MKKKGFTLVELLVVIVILGIITGISIPLIRNIREKNEQKQYTTYMDSLKVSAKLYVNSYEEDLFGHEKNGCAIIKYSDLVEKNLIKDIPIDKVSCNSEETYVKVIKFDGKIIYDTAIGCGSVGEDGKVQIETQYPENGLMDIDSCRVNSSSIITFHINPAFGEEKTYQRRNITLQMSSHTGFQEGIQIRYGFVREENKPESEGAIDESKLINGWKTLEVKYIGGNEQKKMIAEGNPVVLSSEKIITPENETGRIYVVFKIDNLKELSGRNWKNSPETSDYIYKGPYLVDNTKPVIQSLNAVSARNDYNTLNPKIQITATDNNKYSETTDLKMCVSIDTDTCSKKASDIKNGIGYSAYTTSKQLNNIQTNLDGSTHTIFVTISDAAGNNITQTTTYRISLEVLQTRTSSWNNCKTGSPNECVGENVCIRQEVDPTSCRNFGTTRYNCNIEASSGNYVRVFFDPNGDFSNTDENTMGTCELCTRMRCAGYRYDSCARRRNTCSGGWNDWTAWYDTTSCTATNSQPTRRECQTVYR